MIRSSIAILLFFPLWLLAQEPDAVPARLPYANAKAFIRGQQDQQAVGIGFLQAGFEVASSDNSYTIKHFRVCWAADESFMCISIDGNYISPENNNYSLRDILPGSLLTFDDIVATKEGKDYKIRPFVVRTEDIDENRLTLKNPLICHDKKGRLVCYNDGTYILHFAKKKFTGFITADSLVAYNEKEKKLSIATDPAIKLAGINVNIQLKDKAISFSHGSDHITLDSFHSTALQLGGLNFEFLHGSANDTIKFTAYGKKYLIKVRSWTKTWRWEIVEKHDASTFTIMYKWKTNNPEFVFIRDDEMRYGMAIATSFRTGKRIWYLESEFIELQHKNGQEIITPVPLDPSYRFKYNRFGKLKKKQSQGEIKYCNCD